MSTLSPLLDSIRDVFSPQTTNEILVNAGRKVGVAAEGMVSDYPTASGKPLALYYTRQRKDGSTYMSKFKSLKQQRYVMALAAKGKIPYRRTGTMGKSIVSQASLSGNGVVIVAVGSNLEYAIYVIDKFLQSYYHLGTWTPIQDDIEAALPQLSAIAVSSIANDVNRRLKNG